jgi:hypothetical protein
VLGGRKNKRISEENAMVRTKGKVLSLEMMTTTMIHCGQCEKMLLSMKMLESTNRKTAAQQ